MGHVHQLSELSEFSGGSNFCTSSVAAGGDFLPSVLRIWRLDIERDTCGSGSSYKPMRKDGELMTVQPSVSATHRPPQVIALSQQLLPLMR